MVQLNNLFLFTGEEAYLLNQQLKGWKQSFLEKHGELNLDTLYFPETPLKEIEAALFATPFLGEKRLIIVHGLPQVPPKRKKVSKKAEKKDELLKIFAKQLEQIPETSVVVFVQNKPDKRKAFYKALVKLAQIKTFEPLQGGALNQWVKEQVAKRAMSMDYAVVNDLIHRTGGDLWRLSHELDKLMHYAPGQPITKEILQELVTPVMEANVFHLTDALGARKPKKAIHHLHQLMGAGESLHAVMFMMVRQFRLLTQAKGYLQHHSPSDSKGFASSCSLHPFVARTVLGQQKAFDLQTLKKAYGQLLEIDTGLKTGKIRMTVGHQEPLALELEKFLLGFGKARNKE